MDCVVSELYNKVTFLQRNYKNSIVKKIMDPQDSYIQICTIIKRIIKGPCCIRLLCVCLKALQ